MKKQKRHHGGYHVAIAMIFCVFVGVIGHYVWSGQQEKPNAQDYCFKVIKNKVAIVIDKTDLIPVQTQEEIVKRSLTAIQKHTKVGDLVIVYEITQDSLFSLKPVFRMCRPQSGDDVSALNSNVNKVDRQFKNIFEKPLLEILSKNTGQAQNSPIAEAIADINLSDAMRDAEQGRIILFSDLMQHSSNVSTYKCQNAEVPIAQFRKSRQGAVEPRPLFKNVHVELHVIPRLGISELEAKCRATFWNWFFGNMEKTDQAQIGISMLDLPGAYGTTVANTSNTVIEQP